MRKSLLEKSGKNIADAQYGYTSEVAKGALT